MKPTPPKSLLARLEPPLRRVVAIDAGSRSVKLALVERSFGRVRLLQEQSIDLQEEGLVSAEEIASHFRTTLEALGRPPVAITLPQHLATTQLISLPLVPDDEVRRLIAEETKRLSGVSETAIINDFVRVRADAAGQQYWVTLCQEGEIRDQIERLGLEEQEICEVTTTANALITAFGALAPEQDRAVLVHAGAQSTVVVILLGGYGVFASSFSVGGDFFTRAIAGQVPCPVETAEAAKRTKNLFQGADALPGFPAVVEGWLTELVRQLHEWSEDHPGAVSNLKSFEIFLSGGVFAQPGLVPHLRERSGLDFKPWPAPARTGGAAPSRGFEVAFGTALQALGQSAQPASLLPPDRRAAWQRRLTRQLVECGSAVLLCVLLLLLLAGTWQQSTLIRRKTALLDKVQAALGQAQTNERLTESLAAKYDQLRPLLERQQQTTATLQTLALLQQARSNRPAWYVLFGDQLSYFTQPLPVVVGTNPPGATNLTISLRHGPPGVTNQIGSLTNALAAKPGFIAELCIPEDPESARRTFAQLVADLKQDELFARVDSLSEDLRRGLADPKVLLPERHFALALELADAQWERTWTRRRSGLSSTNAVAKPASRLTRGTREGEEFGDPIP